MDGSYEGGLDLWLDAILGAYLSALQEALLPPDPTPAAPVIRGHPSAAELFIQAAATWPRPSLPFAAGTAINDAMFLHLAQIQEFCTRYILEALWFTNHGHLFGISRDTRESYSTICSVSFIIIVAMQCERYARDFIHLGYFQFAFRKH
jgi:hypothetical protein